MIPYIVSSIGLALLIINQMMISSIMLQEYYSKQKTDKWMRNFAIYNIIVGLLASLFFFIVHLHLFGFPYGM